MLLVYCTWNMALAHWEICSFSVLKIVLVDGLWERVNSATFFSDGFLSFAKFMFHSEEHFKISDLLGLLSLQSRYCRKMMCFGVDLWPFRGLAYRLRIVCKDVTFITSVGDWSVFYHFCLELIKQTSILFEILCLPLWSLSFKW